MVESHELLELGLDSGALCVDDDGVPNYVVLEDQMHRIVAPSITNKDAYSIIFWKMSDEKDTTPSPEKIVRKLFFFKRNSHLFC